MKLKRFLTSATTLAAVGATLFTSSLNAATNAWVGDTNNVFTNNLNWTGDALPNFGTDIMRFDGAGTQGNSTITGVNLTMTNTGTTAGTNQAQILFNGSTPALTLTGGTITLGTAATNTYNNAIVLSSGSTVTQTIGSDIVIDDGKAYTASFVNASNSGTGAVLAFTGNITGGTGGTAGLISLGFGNTNTHNGDYSVSGNITKGATATGISITKRGTGVLTLTGTNSLGNGTTGGLAQNEAGTIRIAGGNTTVNNAIDTANALGGNDVASTLQISGGSLNVNGARSLRTNLVVSGGTFNIGTAGAAGRLSFTAGKTLEITSGALNLNSTTGSFGVRLGGDSGAGSGGAAFTGNQTGGTFTVSGGGGQDTTFQLGSTTASIVTSYSLSGGTLDVKGSNNANGYVTLGADTGGTSNTTFTLSGSGKLISRYAPNTAGGINGKNASAVQVLSLTGGTLVAGRIDAANLRGSIGGTNGTIVNNGTTIAPGDTTLAGRTTINGSLTINSGVFDVNIGGTTAATLFQEASNSATFDNINLVTAATRALSLGGTFQVSFFNSATPALNSTFNIITGATSATGSFTNSTYQAYNQTDSMYYTFTPSFVGNDVRLTLTSISAIPEPSTYAAAFALMLGALIAVRRRKARMV